MTREEAIKRIDEQYKICEEFYYLSANPEKDCPGVMSYMEALAVAISALRPVSREMVERMFPGCEKCKSVCHRCLNYPVALYPKACRTCVEHSNYESASNFCEDCGKPLTDEAVEMVLERLEALYE